MKLKHLIAVAAAAFVLSTIAEGRKLTLTYTRESASRMSKEELVNELLDCDKKMVERVNELFDLCWKTAEKLGAERAKVEQLEADCKRLKRRDKIRVEIEQAFDKQHELISVLTNRIAVQERTIKNLKRFAPKKYKID